ncbi:transcriptional regulatory protein GlnR [Planobispora rosea]|uniref:Transcriptional regulatory protein GlnR n=1 Tax=Planobispora rosea TaxID=35762 RepID=A0A8J3S8C6_PLARO|nr:response regulator transcription factor [Planobispora rosea]GGS88091.1 transcriptional regulatory protein GlnR [Planobispora rosea]GIH88590.1 transcriptional regulatory protein GlnR [Planobispora rosea]
MSNLLLLTNALEPSAEVLPALGLLLHSVRVAPAEASALIDAPPADAILVDARRELVQAKSLCRLLRTTGLDCPLLVIVTEGGLAAMTAEWGADDVVLDSAGPAEVEARLRMAVGRLNLTAADETPDEIRNGDLSIDEATYTARLRGRALDLTFKEFELLKYLAQHPGRVFTRAQLLQEVWGYDYFGGTRTVDVHVRRLRAKLGAEYESLIGTVRNVGYRFVPERGSEPSDDREPARR